MNKAVPHYISELLFLHECVIIPEFGGFVGSRKSAELNKFTGTLSPPSKQILFNPNLKSNDGLLVAHIANKEEIKTENAKDNILKFDGLIVVEGRPPSHIPVTLLTPEIVKECCDTLSTLA